MAAEADKPAPKQPKESQSSGSEKPTTALERLIAAGVLSKDWDKPNPKDKVRKEPEGKYETRSVDEIIAERTRIPRQRRFDMQPTTESQPDTQPQPEPPTISPVEKDQVRQQREVSPPRTRKDRLPSKGTPPPLTEAETQRIIDLRHKGKAPSDITSALGFDSQERLQQVQNLIKKRTKAGERFPRLLTPPRKRTSEVSPEPQERDPQSYGPVEIRRNKGAALRRAGKTAAEVATILNITPRQATVDYVIWRAEQEQKTGTSMQMIRSSEEVDALAEAVQEDAKNMSTRALTEKYKLSRSQIKRLRKRPISPTS